MSLQDLLAALESDVEAQAAKLVAEAKADAARIGLESQERLRSARAEDLGATERAAGAAASRQLAVLEREARAERTAARAALLDAIFDDAASRLAAVLEDARYRRAVPRQLLDAASFAPAGAQLEIRCHPAVREALAAERPDGATIVVDASVGAGFILLAESGRLRVDCTLDGRLARLRPQLSIEVLRGLDDVG